MILTNAARSVNAVSFQNANAGLIYAILGQYDPWTSPYSDSSPPPENPTTTSVPEAFCAFPAVIDLMIENDMSGAYSFITTSGTKSFDIQTNPATYITANGNVVMLSGTANGSDIVALQPAFRCVGFAVNLVPASGHESDPFLPAANVSSWGTLIAIENRIPISIISADTYTVRSLPQF